MNDCFFFLNSLVNEVMYAHVKFGEHKRSLRVCYKSNLHPG